MARDTRGNQGPTGKSDAGASVNFEIEGREILSPLQLPPILFLGRRDDRSFSRKGENWSCLYRFEKDPFLELRWNRGMWELVQYWRNQKTGTTFAPGRLANALQQYIASSSHDAPEDPYEQLFKERVESMANVQYWVPDRDSQLITGIPDGRVKGLVCAVTAGIGKSLDRGRQEFRQHCGATIVLTRGERGFQFVTPDEMTETRAKQLASALADLHQLPAGSHSVARTDGPQGSLWRLQIRQQVNLGYFILPWHGTLTLVAALKEGGVLAEPPGDDVGYFLQIVRAGLLAGAGELVGQSSVARNEPWLRGTPVAMATFPPLPPGSL